MAPAIFISMNSNALGHEATMSATGPGSRSKGPAAAHPASFTSCRADDWREVSWSLVYLRRVVAHDGTKELAEGLSILAVLVNKLLKGSLLVQDITFTKIDLRINVTNTLHHSDKKFRTRTHGGRNVYIRWLSSVTISQPSGTFRRSNSWIVWFLRSALFMYVRIP